MHLLLIVAVLVAMTLAESAPRLAIDQAPLRAALVMAGGLALPLLAAMISRVTVRALEGGEDSTAWLARFSLAQKVQAALWIAYVGIASYAWAWPQIVRENWGLRSLVLVDDLLILAPVVGPLLLSWAAYYAVDRALHALAVEHDCATAEPLPGRWKYVLLHARHYLALVLVPLLLVMAIYDGLQLYAPDFAAGPQGWLAMALPVLLLVVALPQLLSSLWKTQRLPDGPLRTRLERVLSASGLTVRDILVWNTHGRMINAAVSGVWSRLRYVFLTDALLDRLDDDQVEAVLRHEAGHVARRHLLLRMLMLGVPIAVWYAAEQAAPELVRQLSLSIAALGVNAAAQQSILVPVLVGVYCFVGLGWYCKQLEYEADLFACGLIDTTDGADVPRIREAFISALEEITAAAAGDRRQSSWLHPSIAARVNFVQVAARDRARAERFARGMACVAWLIALGYATSLIVVALSIYQASL